MASFTSLTTSDGDITSDHFTQGNDVKVNWTYTGDINEITINKIDSNQNKTALIEQVAGKTSAVITGKWVWLCRFPSWFRKPSSWSPMYIKVSDGTKSATYSGMVKYWLSHGNWSEGDDFDYSYRLSPQSFKYNVPLNMFSTGSLTVEFWKNNPVEVHMKDCKITFNDGEVFNFADRDTRGNEYELKMRNKTFTFGAAPHVPIVSDLNFTYNLPTNISDGTYILELYDNLGQVQKIQKIITIGPQKFLYKYEFDSKLIKLSNGNVYNYPQDDKIDPYIFSTETSNEYNTISSIKHQETHKIKWKVSSKISKVKIDLHNDSGFVKEIASDINAQTEYHDWYLNGNVNSSVLTGNNYFIKITNVDDVSKYMSSDKFSIISTKVKIKHPYNIKNGIKWTYEWNTDLQDIFSLSLYHYSFSTKKFELYTYSENNNSFNGFIFQNETYSLNINQKYDWNIPLNFIHPDEGVTYVKLESTNTLYSKYSRIKFIKPEINDTIFKKSNKILDDAESFGHTINKLKNNNYILVWYQKINGQAPTTIKYKITDNAHNSIVDVKTIDLSNNDFVHNFLTSQLRNKIISFNDGYVLLLPEHYKDNNISKWKMYLYFYDANGNLDTTTHNGKIQAFTAANPIHETNNQYNYWANNHNFQLKNTDNGGFIIIKTVEKGDVVFREYDSYANPMDGDVILFSDPFKNKYTVELVNLKSNSYMFFYRLFDTNLTDEPYYAKKFFYDGATRNMLPTTGNFNLNLYNGNFKVNKIPVLKKTIALNENYVLVPFEVFDDSLETPKEIVMGKILDVTNNNWNIISFDNPDTELNDEILSKTESLDSINGIFEYEFQKLNNELIFKYITNEENKKYQNIRFFRIMDDYKSIFQVFNELNIDFESLDTTLSDGGTSIESENKIILTDNIQNFSLYVSSQNPGLHNLEFNMSKITDIRIINSSPVFPYLINTSTVIIDWSENFNQNYWSDTSDNMITLGSTSDFNIGDVIIYNKGDGNGISPLVNNNKYKIKTLVGNVISLQEPSGVDTIVLTYEPPITYQWSSTQSVDNTITLVSVSGLNVGDVVLYEIATISSNPISGLTPGTNYIIKTLVGNVISFQTSDTDNTTRPLTYEAAFDVNCISVDITTDTITLSSPLPGWINVGDIINYINTTGSYNDPGIGGLWYGGSFIVKTKVGNTYTFEDPLNYVYPTGYATINLTSVGPLTNFKFQKLAVGYLGSSGTTFTRTSIGAPGDVYSKFVKGKYLLDTDTVDIKLVKNNEITHTLVTDLSFSNISYNFDINLINDLVLTETTPTIDTTYKIIIQSGTVYNETHDIYFTDIKNTYTLVGSDKILNTPVIESQDNDYIYYKKDNNRFSTNLVSIPGGGFLMSYYKIKIRKKKSSDSSYDIEEYKTNGLYTDNSGTQIFVDKYDSNFQKVGNTYTSPTTESLYTITGNVNLSNIPFNYNTDNTLIALKNGKFALIYVSKMNAKILCDILDHTTMESNIQKKELASITTTSPPFQPTSPFTDIISKNDFKIDSNYYPFFTKSGNYMVSSYKYTFNTKKFTYNNGFGICYTKFTINSKKIYLAFYDENANIIRGDVEIPINSLNHHQTDPTYNNLRGSTLSWNDRWSLNDFINRIDLDITIMKNNDICIFVKDTGTAESWPNNHKDLVYLRYIIYNYSGNTFNHPPNTNQYGHQFTSLLHHTTTLLDKDSSAWNNYMYVNILDNGNIIFSWDNETPSSSGPSNQQLMYTYSKLFDKDLNLIKNVKIDYHQFRYNNSGSTIGTDLFNTSLFQFNKKIIPIKGGFVMLLSSVLSPTDNIFFIYDNNGEPILDSLFGFNNDNLFEQLFILPKNYGFSLVYGGINNNLVLKDYKNLNLTINFVEYPTTLFCGQTLNIQWIYGVNMGTTGKLDLIYESTPDNFDLSQNIIQSINLGVDNSGYYNWVIPYDNFNNTPYKFKMTSNQFKSIISEQNVPSITSIQKPNWTSITYPSEANHGSTFNIQWDYTGNMNFEQQDISSLKLEIIKIDGSNLYTLVENLHHKTKNFNFNIPFNNTNFIGNFKIKMSDLSGHSINTDISGTVFSFVQPEFKSFTMSSNIIKQGDSVDINWDYSGNISNIKIDLMDNNGFVENIVDNRSVTNKSFVWNIPYTKDISGTGYTLKIHDIDNNATLLEIPSLEIVPTRLTISNIQSSYNQNESYIINWDYSGNVDTVKIDLLDNNDNIKYNIIDNSNVIHKSYDWKPTLSSTIHGTNFKIKFSDKDESTKLTTPIVSSLFSIVKPIFNISKANIFTHNEILFGIDYNINWNHSLTLPNIKIDLMDNNGFVENIVDNRSVTNEPFVWNIPLTRNYDDFNNLPFHIRIRDKNLIANDISSNTFQIIKGDFTLINMKDVNNNIVSDISQNENYTIYWDYSGNIKYINLGLYINDECQEMIVENHNINTKSYPWIPNLSKTVAGNNFTIKITDFSGNINTKDTSQFSIIKPSFTISQTNIINTNKVLFGTPYNINWTHNLTIKSIQIDLFDIDGNKNDTIITELDINNKPFVWSPTFEYSSGEFKYLFNNIDITKDHLLKISDLSGNADSISSLQFQFIDSSIESLTIPSSISQNRSSTINWEYSGNISNIKIDLLDNNNNFQMNIIDNSNVSLKTYNWTPDLSKNMFGTNKFKIRIYDISENSGSYDSSLFSIVKPSLSVFTTSIEDNRIIMSNTYDISWNFELDIDKINLFLMKNNNKVLINNSSIVSNRSVNPYPWTLPLTTQNVSDISGTGYYIRIEDADNIAEPVDSPTFEIVSPKFTYLTIPPTVNQNQNTIINWDYSGNINTVKIELIDADDSQVFDTIIDNSNVSLKTYNWKPNFNKFMFGSFKLKITDLSGFSSFICSSS
jgi:hypothetical protein